MRPKVHPLIVHLGSLLDRAAANVSRLLSRGGRKSGPLRPAPRLERLEERLAPATSQVNPPVTYQVVNKFTGGLQAQLTLTNNQAVALNNWQLSFQYAGAITSIWDAQVVSHQGTQYVIAGLSWDSSLNAGASELIGFVASTSGTPAAPSNYVLQWSNNTASGGTTPVTPGVSVADSFVSEPSLLSGVGIGYYHTAGNQILDANNQPVRIAGVEWNGLETSSFAPSGLQSRNYKDMMDQMKALGFNTIELPLSDQLFNAGSTPSGINYTLNPDLKGLSGLQILDKVVSYAGQTGLRILLVHERSDAGSGPNGNGLWYTSSYPQSRWISDWTALASRYAGNSTVIGADLAVGLHGLANWGGGNARGNYDWRLAAQAAGNAILGVNSKWLIFVEGVQTTSAGISGWGENLANAAAYPVKLNTANRVVYSPHEDPPSFEPQPWYSDPSYPNNLPAVWDRFWGYLYRQNLAPVLLDGFGSTLATAPDQQWASALVTYIDGGVTGSGTLASGTLGVSWIWAAWNPTNGETGGILASDWTTVNQTKLSLLGPAEAPIGSPGVGSFHTSGNQILDANNQPVRIAGVEWNGLETSSFAPDGLQFRSYQSMMNEMKALGFNTIELPFSDQLFDPGSIPSGINFTLNPDLQGLSGQQIIDKIVAYAGQIGLRIILVNERSSAGSGPNGNGFWYTSDYPQATWINDWKLLARDKNLQTPTVLGADLAVGLHGQVNWGRGDANDWRLAAQAAGNAILALNPGWLIFVEGVQTTSTGTSGWGENLSNAAAYPVRLNRPNHVVYAPHEDPPSFAAQSWFSAVNFPKNLPQIWNQFWGYLYLGNIAPVMVDGFGSPLTTTSDQQWASSLVSYINGGIQNGSLPAHVQAVSWTWAAWNPTNGETGGILGDDWNTINQAKVSLLQPALAPFGSGTVTFTVTLAQATTQTVTVAYTTRDGSARAGLDYLPVSGTLTFNPGTTSQLVSVPVLSNAFLSSNVTFTLQLTTATGGTLTRSQATATIVVHNSFPSTPPAPSLSISNVSVADPASGTVNAVFPVTLSAVSSQVVTVAYATADGTALAGRDYGAVSGVLTFNPGQIQQTISVPIFSATSQGINQTFTIQLSSPTNATLVTASATGTILVPQLPLSLSIGNVSVMEPASGTATAIFPVTLSSASTQTVTVAYATANGTALAGRDYLAVSGQLTFNPGQTQQTISVPIFSVASQGVNETFTVQLVGPINAVLGTGTATGTIIVPPPPLSLSIGNVSVTEPASGTTNAVFTVTLSTASTQSVTVSYRTVDGTAAGGRDYTAQSGQLTFSPGQTQQTIIVPVLSDTATGANETFTVQLSNPSNAVLGVATATGTITEPAPLSLSIGNVSVGKPASGTTTNAVFTVALSAAGTQSVTVNYKTVDGTAKAGLDYTTVNGQLTFSPGQTQQTILVPILSNAALGTNATFTVQLSSPTNAILGTSSATGTITTSSPSTTKAVVFTNTGDWGSGFTATMVVNNLGTTTLNGWTLDFDLAADITTYWNAVLVSHTGNHYVFQNVAYNGTIPPGGSTAGSNAFGFQGSPGLNGAVPTNVKLNGVLV